MLTSLLGGAAMYWLQVYGYYQPAVFKSGEEITLTLIDGGVVEPILVEGITGIAGDASPLHFRACFHTPVSLGLLSETFVAYAKPTPLTAPNWFDCFDADKIGEALESGAALAFLSRADVAPGIDRVVAVYSDGRAYAWHQIAANAEK